MHVTVPGRTKVPISHPIAALTPRHRLKVAHLVVDQNWPISEVAARFQVSWPTVKRWVDRYLADESIEDRSSRPKYSPNKTPLPVAKRCISLRIRLREGPVQLGARLNRLTQLDRATGEPVRRDEHPHPGALVRVDMKKQGNIPDGGGWRYVGRRQGDRNRSATPDKSKNKWHSPKMGYAFVHTVRDDHSRVAFTEVHDDETAVTAAGVLHRAAAWFAQRGATIERVLSDNGAAYRSHLWRDTCDALAIRPKWTRPYRPQTIGKVERFHRTMADGWAYARCYQSETERRDALQAWLRHYNQHRPHRACGNDPPFSKLTNVPGQYS